MKLHVFRHSHQDAYLVVLSLLHLSALVLVPSIPLIALGVWWNSNTISHHFLHLPFFRSSTANRLYSLFLSVLIGIPQGIWRDRHLAHHRGMTARLRSSPGVATEIALIVILWSALVLVAPRFLLWVYIPGIAVGLLICYLHGHFEHAGGTTSNYGVFYNLAFFNDGYHVEHHEKPSEHWTRMRAMRIHNARTSRWPAALRWIETANLETLERLVLRSSLLQSFLLRTHERALRRLLPDLPPVKRVTIVGGGMYPRTALILRRLLPEARIHIVDSDSSHLEMAKPFLDERISLEHVHFTPHSSENSDLLVIPLSFSGRRQAIYENPPAPAVLVHDWLWNTRGISTIVSLLLLKRINLIVR